MNSAEVFDGLPEDLRKLSEAQASVTCGDFLKEIRGKLAWLERLKDRPGSEGIRKELVITALTDAAPMISETFQVLEELGRAFDAHGKPQGGQADED